ncbi:MAG: glycosyltransferase [Clostridiales bacterium]|nr:glycosyltransferase [Clostridiales bacterium]
MGRLSVEKNQCFIVEIFKAFHDRKQNSKLILVGDGALRGRIEHKISELGLNDVVVMTGKRTDIRAILSGIDIFIMPSIFEGTPVSAIEARTSGLPCLLSDTITKSVNMKGIKYFSVQEPPELWAREAEGLLDNNQRLNRHDYSEVVKHGFDIEIEAIKLQEYYLALR